MDKPFAQRTIVTSLAPAIPYSHVIEAYSSARVLDKVAECLDADGERRGERNASAHARIFRKLPCEQTERGRKLGSKDSVGKELVIPCLELGAKRVHLFNDALLVHIDATGRLIRIGLLRRYHQVA